MSSDSSLPLPRLDCGVAVLRPWRLDDLDSLVASANDASVSRSLRDRFPYPYTGDDGRAWLTRAVDESDRAWALEIDGSAVGGVSLHPGVDVHRHSAELGYWLAQRHWGHGIMTAVIRAFAPRAMDAFRLYRLYATVYETNPASARVLEKAGFAREGVQKSAVVKRGELLDLYVYALVRRELENHA
ncbi:GNAT family protein [Dokdonella sp.]|uniref:GNAT family N-acetyltransferase n=1 Tax=Dokdonella sp. TaxID=2291710 RepID=UPI001B01EB94|nr:GNAT family protein [Dokdonella sp.]MBO9664650.1 GNAT family N-acetyltransferase [Dokdonella sp.]